MPKEHYRNREKNKGKKAARKAAVSRHGYDAGRRRILKFLAVGGALVATGGVGAYLLKDQFGGDEGVNRDSILEDAQRQEILPSAAEQDLWRNSFQSNTSVEIEPDEGAIRDRILGTLDKMLSSENPYFSSASGFMLGLSDAGRMRFEAIGHPDDKSTSLGVTWEINGEGKLGYVFYINGWDVMNRASSLLTAGTATHEAEHMRRFEDFLTVSGAVDPAQQILALDANFLAGGKIHSEEAAAYGVEAEAYIYQTGLLGRVYDTTVTGQDERAVKYISFGKNSQDPRWVSYIAEIAII